MQKKYWNHYWFLVSFIISLNLISCGKLNINTEEEMVKSKDRSDSLAQTNNTNNTEVAFEYLFDDESVNNSSISFDDASGVLSLTCSGGVNASGGFQGGGTGNKPIAALDGFNGVDLGDFSISWDYDQGQDIPWMNILIDNDDDGIADNIIVPLSASGGSFSFSGASDSFKVVCVPTCGTWSSNQYDIDDYPNATIVDSTISDGGMPAGSLSTSINGVLFSMGGGSSETSVLSAEISNLESNLD
ncbi:hypothetical protein N9N67_00905 [Bacteriovoracaceae bacterium]|nr:hypothetical protein [Bacteriovoracaceae bacterium]